MRTSRMSFSERLEIHWEVFYNTRTRRDVVRWIANGFAVIGIIQVMQSIFG